jgi:uncharacterized protein YajQ (UPF0234 family)
MRRSVSRIEAQPIEAVQEALDGLVADLRFTQAMCDQLTEREMWRDTMFGKEPNEWIKLRDEYRQKVAELAGRMIERGIAEKAVNVSAAQTALMATMVKEALVRAGIPADQVAKVGNALREIAQEAQGG